MDLPLTRVSPGFSSVRGPSSTSITSCTSAFLMVLALLIGNSSVIAMDLTTTKYCCRRAKNFLLPMPPTSMCLHKSLACSGAKETPSRESRCLQKASSEIRSSPPSRSSWKRSSGPMPLVCVSARRAVAAWEYLASTMPWQEARAASMALALLRSTAMALPSIFANSFLASSMGPLAVLPTWASCSLMHALAAATLSAVWAWSFSASSSTEAGVGNASSSAPWTEMRGCTISSRDFRLASIAPTLATASARIASAAFRSRASMCAFFSAASFLANSTLAAATFFFRASKVVCIVVTFGRDFASSVLASASGPLGPAFASSVPFTLRRFETVVMLLFGSANAFSIALAKVENGVMASKYFVPWFPSIVTKPVFPLEMSLHSKRVMPFESSLVGLPRASTMVPGSTLPLVLLLAISKTSVSVMLSLQTNCFLNACLKSSRLMAPSSSTSMCLKMAVRRSSVKVTSSCSVTVGSFSRYAQNASSGTFPSAPPSHTCANKASSLSSFFAMWSLNTEANVITLLATRNSAPPRSRSGAQAVLAASRSASTFSMRSDTSARSFLAVNFCSLSLMTFFAFASSTIDSERRSCSFCRASLWVAAPLGSFCLAERKARCLSILACTSFTWPASSSQSLDDSSSVMLSAMKGSTASVNFFTSPSTTVMPSAASCICADVLRASVSRLNWLSLAAAVLMRSVCLMNSSATGFDIAESYCLISRFLEAMKVRALLMAVCTVVTSASDSAMVSVASLRGKTSMPLRKGSSTSLTF
mmetsp:Transcript_24053/g.74751  ORF Transcript_24053/g.74751 Transcript_24053/m.74751 type:complete len:762 (+) Transcript_24053:1490-3775(+)